METITEFRGKNRFLSNFYPCEIEYEGIVYPSTEHAYQAAKSDDIEVRQFIATLKTPSLAKSAGKEIDKPLDWHERSLDVMYDVCSLKFQIPELREKLLETGHCMLEEGNTWGDTFWGICDDVGENHLGRILMRIRADIVGSDLIRQAIDDDILSALQSQGKYLQTASQGQ